MAEEQYFDLLDVLIWDSLSHAVKKYGIEATEEKIKKLYKLMPKARDKMLKEYYKIYGLRKNNNK